MPPRDKIPKGKARLEVLISKELYETVLSVAPAWYGKGKGGISALVEDALKFYFNLKAHTKDTQKPNPSRSVRAVYQQVKDKVKEILKLDYYPDEVPEKILDLAIAETRGSDPRTVNKWKSVFEKAGLIKYLGGFKPNRVVELL
jgi:hypothetical protein